MNFSSDKLRPFVDVTSLKFRGGIPLKYSFNYDINYASTKVNPRHNVSLIMRGCVLIIARRNVNQLLSTLTFRGNFYSNNWRKEFKRNFMNFMKKLLNDRNREEANRRNKYGKRYVRSVFVYFWILLDIFKPFLNHRRSIISPISSFTNSYYTCIILIYFLLRGIECIGTGAQCIINDNVWR